MDTLGSRIRFARGKTSQEAFAKTLQISKGSLGFYERDENLPNSDVILKICSITGVSLVWLMTGTGPMESDKKIEIKHDVSSPTQSKNICCNCLELYKRLDIINERLHMANEREMILFKENTELKTKNAELQNKISLFASYAESKENTA